jgi:thiosulfate/3-mercaptopyruvate sulfurtransferase
MRKNSNTIEPSEMSAPSESVIFYCRFSLADPEEGERLYRQAHIPGARYLHLERDMSSTVQKHGGRHPLPDPANFVDLLASHGVGPETDVIAYDDNRFAYAARLWWLMKSLGFKPPVLLNGGFKAWVDAGGDVETSVPGVKGRIAAVSKGLSYSGSCDIGGLRDAQGRGCMVIDSREERRYQGLEEPIDPVAGHIPGALNQPWQKITDSTGKLVDEQAMRKRWGEVLGAQEVVVYCGSGVTACVNLFSLASLGRDDAVLYAGSWSDWCSYL